MNHSFVSVSSRLRISWASAVYAASSTGSSRGIARRLALSDQREGGLVILPVTGELVLKAVDQDRQLIRPGPPRCGLVKRRGQPRFGRRSWSTHQSLGKSASCLHERDVVQHVKCLQGRVRS